MEIRIENIKEVREKTGAGMMDCKKALMEMNGNIEQATAYLQKKGFDIAAKKAERFTMEGLIKAHTEPQNNCGSIIEINCETDFVAKNTDFCKFTQEVAELITVLNPDDIETLLTLPMANGKTVNNNLADLIAKMGENIVIRRLNRFEGTDVSQVSSYIHNDYLTEGKAGVLVEFKAAKSQTLSNPDFATFMKDIMLQLVSLKPEYIDRRQIPSPVMEEKKASLLTQAINEGKPKEIAEKIMRGRLDKYCREVCLYEQEYIKDNEKTISQLIQEMKLKFADDNLSIVRFVRFEKGETSAKNK
jgi:elongation factor Ts